MMTPLNAQPPHMANYDNVTHKTAPTWPSSAEAVVTNEPSGDFITMEQYFTGLKVNVAVRCLVCAGGMLGNVLNIRTFYRMGLEDSVTIAFFNLAVLDLFVLVTTFIGTVSTLCQILERDLGVYFYFNPYFITLLSINFGRIFAYACSYVTTFLALQRCLCVVIPFHFKGDLTRLRTCVIMVVIWGDGVSCGSVLMSQNQIQKRTVANTSLYVYVLILKPMRRYVISYLQIANNITLNVICVLLVFVCVVVMPRTLRKSVQFRQTTASMVSKVAVIGKDSNSLSEAESSKNVSVSSSKERLVIVQVSLVSAIFLTMNTPNLVISIASSIEPQFRHYRTYHYTFASCIDIRLTFESINSAVNFFVYYNYNTKFRQICFKRQ